ncbi:P2X purinoceptor 4-like isoform X2 [Dermacentor andersoni]|uniref:P2X purinoceptor 4-like isoform X2 n=1 Tax=Dermacentor andersoni TaxID=34620 RepID=UPI0021554521|nr:P2X purinoceptor 4-like isoform X2 [Dermacentor andersoni]
MGFAAALAAVESATVHVFSAFFFEYRTLKVVQIGNRKIGLLNRTIQLVIIGFIIGYALIYEKGYQRYSSCTSAVTVKVKGALSTESLSEDAFKPALGDTRHYRRMWDNEDIVVPPHDSNQFFITTNVILTPNQTISACPEELSIKQARCKSENDTTSCKRGASLRRGHGIMTGRCVRAAHPDEDQYVCEIRGWCPVERHVLPLKNGAGLLAGVRNFTIFIKNYVQFPLFKVRRRNIPDRVNASYLRSCLHETSKSSLCPIFRIGDMVEQAGADFDTMARKGGVIQIMITWDCDLDYDPKHCLPDYSFLRLDDPDARVAQGFNFRYAKYYSETSRSLVKAYGINFVVLVRGEAGRTSIIPIAVTLGSGLGLLAVATVLCDFVAVHFDKRKKLYKAKKFKFVSKRDSCNLKVPCPDLGGSRLKRRSQVPFLRAQRSASSTDSRPSQEDSS